jgi:hypothetical protein
VTGVISASIVPTLLERAGDFSESVPPPAGSPYPTLGTPYYFHNPAIANPTATANCMAASGIGCLYPAPYDKIPTLDPVARKLLAYDPLPNVTGDALRGDWQGEGGYVAQVVPVMDKIYSREDLIPQEEDNGKYEAHIFKQFDQPNDTPVAVLMGSLAGGTLTLEGGGWTGTIDGGHFKAKNGGQSIDLQHITRTSPTMGIKPPNGAIVLLDGKNIDSWAKMTEKEWLKEDASASGT